MRRLDLATLATSLLLVVPAFAQTASTSRRLAHWTGTWHQIEPREPDELTEICVVKSQRDSRIHVWYIGGFNTPSCPDTVTRSGMFRGTTSGLHLSAEAPLHALSEGDQTAAQLDGDLDVENDILRLTFGAVKPPSGFLGGACPLYCPSPPPTRPAYTRTFRRAARGIYRRALERAGDIDSIEVEDTQTASHERVKEFRNYAFVEAGFKFAPVARRLSVVLMGSDVGAGPVIYRTPVTLGNHAAMILLRDEFVSMMRDRIRQLDSVNTKDCRVVEGLRARLVSDALSGKPTPLLEISIPIPLTQPDVGIPVSGPPVPRPAPGPLAGVPLRRLLDSGATRYSVAAPGVPLIDMQRLAIARALPIFRSAMVNAIAIAQATADDDLPGLLKLTGNGFGPVVTSLLPKIVEPDSSPDPIGRAEVRKIESLFFTVREQTNYASFDTDVAIALTLPLAALTPVGLPICTAAMVAAVARAANDYREADRESEFAKQAVAILGSRHYDDVQAKADAEFWKLVQSVVALAAGPILGVASEEAALILQGSIDAEVVTEGHRVIAALADANGNLVPEAFEGLSGADQRAVVSAAIDARIAQETGATLTQEQQRALQVVNQLAERVRDDLAAADALAESNEIARAARDAGSRASPPNSSFNDTGVRGAIGEAAYQTAQSQKGNANVDMNAVLGRPNAALLDNVSKSEGFVSVKNYGNVDKYKGFLQDLLVTKDPETVQLQMRAAREILDNKDAIQRAGAWPEGLSADASETEIRNWINQNAKLAVPSDQVAQTRALVERDMVALPENYGLPNPSIDPTAYQRQYNAILKRIISMGMSSEESRLMVTSIRASRFR